MKFNKNLFFASILILFVTNIVWSEENDSKMIDSPAIIKPWIGIKVNNHTKSPAKIEISDGVEINDILNIPSLKKGDIVKKIGDIEITNIEDFNRIIASKKIGDNLKLTIMRGFETMEISVILEDAWKRSEEILKFLGLKVKPVSKANLFGIIVTDVLKDSKAEKYGINKNDIILGVNRNFFKDLEGFNEIISHVNLENEKSKDPCEKCFKEIYLLVMRKDDSNAFITVTKQIGEKKEQKDIQKSARKSEEHGFEE